MSYEESIRSEGGDITFPRSAPLQASTMYLVATPIGNLEDISLRSLRALGEADLILCEDTRHTGRLLKAYGLKRPLLSLHKFNERSREERVLDELGQGRVLALVSDAGSPGVCDPGARLVAAVWNAGFRVEAIPGACALICALTTAGFSGSDFYFGGFLPIKSGQRGKRLAQLAELSCSVVLYESPYRVLKLMAELVERFPGRQVAVCRELTKKFEEIQRGPVEAVNEQMKTRKPRGEYVVVLAPADQILKIGAE